MENKRRIRLNLFDGIVIALALCVGAVLLWMNFKPAAPTEGDSPSTVTARYTLLLRETIPGTGDLIKPGDKLEDVIKNLSLGTVVSAEVRPATATVLSQTEKSYVVTEVPGREEILLVVEGPIIYGDQAIQLESGYVLRVGATAYVRGPGYLSSAEILDIARKEN